MKKHQICPVMKQHAYHIKTKTITSPHDTTSYTSFILKEESIEIANQLLLNVESIKMISVPLLHGMS